MVATQARSMAPREIDIQPGSAAKELKLTLPIVPSMNHCYRNVSIHRRILTKIGQAWVDQAQWMARTEAKRQGWNFAKKQKVIMELWAFWPDYRTRDMSNMHKLLPDALEGILYDNDRYVLIRDMDFAVDKGNPRVEVRMRLQ